MRLKLAVFVLLGTFAFSAYAVKKPTFSFGVFGGLTGAGMFSSEVPEMNFNPYLVELDDAVPYKSYLPDTLMRDGVNPYGNYSFDYTTNFLKNMIFNIAAGINFDVPIKSTDRWAIKFQAAYQTMGMQLSNEITESKSGIGGNTVTTTTLYSRDVKNNYLVMPLMAKFSWPGRTSYFVQAGPYAGLLLNSRVSGSSIITELSDGYSDTDGYEFLNDTTAKSHTHLMDYGVNLGGGIEFYWTKTAYVTLDLNVGFGLRKIDKLYSNNYYELVETIPGQEEDINPNRDYEIQYVSQNYYSLSSQARNFYVMFTVGFRYSIYK